jgi:hypothetical protein
MRARLWVAWMVWGMVGCTTVQRDNVWRPINGKPLELPTAIRRADNDFSPTGDPVGRLEQIPAAVQQWIVAAAGTRATSLGPAYVLASPDGGQLYVARCDGPRRSEYLLVLHDPATGRVSPDTARISIRQSPGDPKFPTMQPPFARWDDLDGDGRSELLMQGTWAGGRTSTSVVTRVFRLGGDLKLLRVADFLTGDHFVWQRNPTGVWIVGALRRGASNRLEIDYACHPLDRPDALRSIGQVAFRYSPSDEGYVEAGAKVGDITFSDFLRLDARR